MHSVKYITRYLIWIVLLYGLIASLLNLDYNSVFIDEAYHISMGHQLLRGEPCPGCPYATGSVTIHPVIAALGDSIGGLYGARAVNIVLGLMLITVIYTASWLLFGDRRLGLIAAVLLLFSGQTMYLMKLATYDMTAAFFLATAFLMVVVSGRLCFTTYGNIALLLATVAVFFASITKYLLPVFIPPLLLYALLRHGYARTLIYSILPLTALLLYFLFYVPYPPLTRVFGQIESVRATSNVPLLTLTDWTFRWVAMAYLLAIFGIFHEERGKTALLLILCSTPIIIVHLATRAEQSVNKNMIFSLVFLAPAAALGVDHIGHLFSMRSYSKSVKAFFTAAVLVVFWVYGVYNLRWLERQYPDVSPVIEFFDENGFDGMTVAMNGWDGVIYSYSLGSKYPNARFMHITETADPRAPGRPLPDDVDFIVCEDLYYGKLFPCRDYTDFIGDYYTLLEDFTIKHSWGLTDAKIYGRK